MKRSTRIAAATGAVALIALMAWAFTPRPLQVEVAAAERGPYEQLIVEDGRTRLRERYTVTAPLAGRLPRITLREGDAVQAGDVVATLTPALAPMLDERTRREQTARAEAAEAALLRAQAAEQRARVAMEQAGLDLRRDEQLARQDFVAPARLDASRLALQAARRDHEVAEQARHVAGHDLETARAAAGAMPPSSGSGAPRPFAVRTPVTGRVLRVAQASETAVAPGTALLEVGDTADLEIVAELLTADAMQAGPGTPVRIDRWGGPGTLQARVRRVEPSAFTKVSALGVEEQRVNVLIDIASPHEAWRALGDGFRVGVNIVTLSQPDVLQVPVSAAFPRSGGGMAVFKVEQGRARVVPVELGGRNGRTAWVRAGLEAGDSVIVYPPTALGDGDRVAIRKPRAE